MISGEFRRDCAKAFASAKANRGLANQAFKSIQWNAAFYDACFREEVPKKRSRFRALRGKTLALQKHVAIVSCDLAFQTSLSFGFALWSPLRLEGALVCRISTQHYSWRFSCICSHRLFLVASLRLECRLSYQEGEDTQENMERDENQVRVLLIFFVCLMLIATNLTYTRTATKRQASKQANEQAHKQTQTNDD